MNAPFKDSQEAGAAAWRRVCEMLNAAEANQDFSICDPIDAIAFYTELLNMQVMYGDPTKQQPMGVISFKNRMDVDKPL